MFFSDFDDVWLRCPLTLYIVDILLITALKKFTVLHENLISGVFACFVGVFARFVGVSARKKNIKIKNQNKKRRTSPTEHFFSPGSSTRILSECLNIWIKSLSAWVFSFRRRRIFEVRLKFRPFGRYRYIPYSSQMMQAKRFKMIHYHPPEAIDHAVQYLDVHWPHASARLEPYLQTWSHIIPHDQICKFWKVYHGVFVCICSILFLSFASVHICPLRCPLCCPWTLSGKSTGSHWMSAGHNGALRVQGVVCGSPNQSSGTHSCIEKFWSYSESETWRDHLHKNSDSPLWKHVSLSLWKHVRACVCLTCR